MVMIGLAQQRVSEQLVSRVLGGLLLFDVIGLFLFDVIGLLLLDVIGRLLFYVVGRFLFDVPAAGADRIRGLWAAAVHRQQRLVKVVHGTWILVVFGERGHAPQRLASTAVRVVHHLHRVDGTVCVQRPPLVRYVRLVGERAGRAVQVETVVAADDRLETVVVVIVIVIVVVVVGERELVVVPLCVIQIEFFVFLIAVIHQNNFF